MWRPWPWLILAILALAPAAGCKRRRRASATRDGSTQPETRSPNVMATPEQLAELRAEVLAEVTPFAGRPEYAITDPAFVDPFISEELESLGRMPEAGSERGDLVWSARAALKNKLREPEGLRALEALIARRYENPVVERIGDVVYIDAGAVAGTYKVFRARIMVGKSPHVDRNEWSSAEVVRHLALGMARYPDAQTFQAEVEIHGRWDKPGRIYVYDRGDDRIRLYSQKATHYIYFTPKLGGSFEAYQNGSASLHPLDLAFDEPGAWNAPPRLRDVKSDRGR